VIIRLLGEGQFRVDDSLVSTLNELDDVVIAAVQAEDERALWSGLAALADAVRANGVPLTTEELMPSDAVVPPEDLSLEEAHELMSASGFVP
jgi:CBS domain-containing protein